jgi:malate dehydrogenase (oxaloacetate-decarboxylating)
MATDYFGKSVELHKKLKGKISVEPKIRIKTREDLSLVYTPGVAQPCKDIAKNPELAFDYTIKGNSVAVVSDGSAVLGLGNIGAKAAIPVMEGKALLFKEFADIDAFPLCLDTQDAEKIIETVKAIAPVFGGINLEDIAAPKCFFVEESLQELGIPVMHDDQHGTAIVVLAGLFNATKVSGKPLEAMKIVISGSGAAGTAIARILSCYGDFDKTCKSVKDIIVVDSKGIVVTGRPDLNHAKLELSTHTNEENVEGTLNDALVGADVFIGVSAPGVLKASHVKLMAKNPIIFALANPVPEIMPDEAKAAGAAIVATGRSDFPNQVNNALAFPGVFRGALDAKAVRITDGMKVAAARAIAACVKKPSTEEIIPAVLDRNVAKKVAEAVKAAAIKEGVVRH